MSAENQDQDFEKLQRLLKLKRHEQPPPRFFNDFSGQVTARIKAGATGSQSDSFEEIVAQTPWLLRIWRAIEGKPAVSGIFTAAVCGLVVAGVFMADKTTSEMPRFELEAPLAKTEKKSLFSSGGSTLATVPVSSTNPAAMLPGSLFNNTPMLQTLPASGMPMPAGAK